MKTMDEIYNQINSLIENNSWDQIERLLTDSMDEAKDEEAHGMYVALGNELLMFFRETGQHEKAVTLSDNILLLMEEFQQDHTENFAYILINAASSCSGAGRFAEAESYYTRAVHILEEQKPFIHEEAQKKYFDVYYVTALCGIAEAAYQLGNHKKALADFEKAAYESLLSSGDGEGTKMLWKNCVSLSALLNDPEKKEYYLSLLKKAESET